MVQKTTFNHIVPAIALLTILLSPCEAREIFIRETLDPAHAAIIEVQSGYSAALTILSIDNLEVEDGSTPIFVRPGEYRIGIYAIGTPSGPKPAFSKRRFGKTYISVIARAGYTYTIAELEVLELYAITKKSFDFKIGVTEEPTRGL